MMLACVRDYVISVFANGLPWLEVVGPAVTTQAPVATGRGSLIAASSTIGTVERSSLLGPC